MIGLGPINPAPEHIRDLCRDVRDMHMNPRHGSPSLVREVIADWCESVELNGYAIFLRPKPAGPDLDNWLNMRRHIIRWLAGDSVPSPLEPAVTHTKGSAR